MGQQARNANTGNRMINTSIILFKTCDQPRIGIRLPAQRYSCQIAQLTEDERFQKCWCQCLGHRLLSLGIHETKKKIPLDTRFKTCALSKQFQRKLTITAKQNLNILERVSTRRTGPNFDGVINRISPTLFETNTSAHNHTILKEIILVAVVDRDPLLYLKISEENSSAVADENTSVRLNACESQGSSRAFDYNNTIRSIPAIVCC